MILVRYDPETGDIVGQIKGSYDKDVELVPVIEVEEQDLTDKQVNLETLELDSVN